MSSKQIARTVRDGRPVTFHLIVGEPVTGYVCGMDDYHWMVVSPEGDKTLIHKGSAVAVRLEDESRFWDEPNVAALDEVVGPFRDFVARAYFSSVAEARSQSR